MAEKPKQGAKLSTKIPNQFCNRICLRPSKRGSKVTVRTANFKIFSQTAKTTFTMMLDVGYKWLKMFIHNISWAFFLISYLWTFWVLRRLSDISLASEERYDSWQGRVLIIKPGMNFLNNSNWSLALSVKIRIYTKFDDEMVHTLKTARLYYVHHS